MVVMALTASNPMEKMTKANSTSSKVKPFFD
jgi:hypothetical protein